MRNQMISGDRSPSLVHQRRVARVAVFGNRSLDDVNDRRPVGMAVPRDHPARLDLESTQAEQAVVDADLSFLDERNRGYHFIGHILGHRRASLLAGAVEPCLAGRTLRSAGATA